MGLPDLFKKKGFFPQGQIRATFHQNANQDRSESAIAVNPTNSLNLVGVSKLFSNPQKYKFTVAAIYSKDGGISWTQSPTLKLNTGWEGLSDPCVVFAPDG